MADQNISIKMEESSSVTRSFLVLLGAFYAWDCTFPVGYRSFLFHFHKEVFGLEPDNPGITYRTFKRDYTNWKSSQ